MKTIRVGVLFLSSVVLAACNSDENQSGAPQDDIVMWVHMSRESAEGEVLQNTVDQFNEEYEGEYKAAIEFIPRGGGGGGYEDKVNAGVSTGTLPDVLTLDGPNTAAYAEAQIIAPLDGYIEDEEDFYPSVIEQGTYDDQLYAIGYSESGVGIYYNKEMFEQAGIDSENLATIDDPWDWNEFTDVAKRLSEEFGTPAIDMMLNDNSEWLMYAFTPFLWSHGGDVVSEDGEEAVGVFDEQQSLETLQFIQNLLQNDYTTISPTDNAFQTGQYPMLMSGSWTIQELATSYPDIEYGMMPYPVSPDTNELVSPTGSWQYAISSTTENEEGAGELVQFLTSTKAIADVSLRNGVLPSRQSSTDMIQDEVPEQLKVLIEQNEKSGRARPVLPAYPQVSRAFQQTIGALEYYEGEEELRELLDERAQQMQTSIDRR
ncbi:ABC transporter substrate-binding protein [Shouchella shacheensis]|uniref:ABC transporter substrate-binding protein n=1 Tax=Shouchella shacheensis TaxID=1649580 RepID=UPI0007403152|nr:sugar ABC transporter substrate-binding protein [Shouchella shacheensis]